MQLINLRDLPPDRPPAAVCLGTFDGVHLGHQALLTATVEAARRQNLTPCAYTFDVPPAAVLGHTPAEVLTPIAEKAALMGAYGVDTVVYSHFDAAVAAHEAEWFFEELLLGRLNARHIVIGFHYHFGRFARGDAELMRSFCKGKDIGLTVVPPVCLPEGTLVSSSAIREALSRGDRRTAETMLNRPLSQREEVLLGGRYNE